MNSCPSPATRFLLTLGWMPGDQGVPEIGWIVMAFCGEHERPVVHYVAPRVGEDLWAEATIADISALPMALRMVGIDAAIDGIDECVVTNVFQPAAVV